MPDGEDASADAEKALQIMTPKTPERGALDEFKEAYAGLGSFSATSAGWPRFQRACAALVASPALPVTAPEVDELVAAAREVKAVHDAQTAYTRELQALAAEARRTGKSQSHRIQIQPRVHDYGNAIASLLEALERLERWRSRHPVKP